MAFQNPRNVHYFGVKPKEKEFQEKEELYIAIHMNNIKARIRIIPKFNEIDQNKLKNWKKEKKLNIFKQFAKKNFIDTSIIPKSIFTCFLCIREENEA